MRLLGNLIDISSKYRDQLLSVGGLQKFIDLTKHHESYERKVWVIAKIIKKKPLL